MTDLVSYRKQRDSLLKTIIESLANDHRFAAGWLTGSYGRGDEDQFSDIDLTVVIASEHSDKFCQRLEQVSAQTSPERYSLFNQFGAPALIHENNNNAPEGGTFTFIMYAESTIMVDCVVIPQSKAKRPTESKLLFDKVGIPLLPVAEPEDLEQSKKSVTETWAFFWMMTAITIKYIHRGDGVFVTQWIENLHHLVRDIERRLARKPWKYTRGSINQLQPTREKQIESIRKLYGAMLDLKPAVTNFIGMEPATPLAEIEILLSLGNNSQSKITNPKS